MSWNYRIISHTEKNKPTYVAIHEVYYNDNGSIYAISEEPTPLMGEDKEDLKRDLELMLVAFEKDTLDFDKIKT